MRLLAIAFLLLSTIAVDAAPRCLSQREARAIYPNDHLFWRSHAGKRCWSSSRLGAPRASKAVPPGPAPIPQPLTIFLPAELASPIWKHMGQQQQAARDDAYAEALLEMLREPETIYSTFDGTPPDVWPKLEDRGLAIILQFISILLGASLAIVVAVVVARSR